MYDPKRASRSGCPRSTTNKYIIPQLISLCELLLIYFWRRLGDSNSVIRPYRGRSSTAMINRQTGALDRNRTCDIRRYECRAVPTEPRVQTGAESGTRTRVNCLADSRTSRCTISAWQGKLELNQSECFQRALPKPLGHSPVKLGSG